MPRKRILSGMRPTGRLHLGHLAGALSNWIGLQKEYQCFFMIADWHALMSEYEQPQLIKEYIFQETADWLSVGIDPEVSTVFLQSEIDAHLSLYMIFSCLLPLSWLERVPTYKEQLREIKNRDLKTYGFLGYPALQAADILIYNADAVPVGEDQLPHLELTREIARRFNHLYKTEFFKQPQALLTQVPKLMGIDGRKMSKSYQNTINLSDPAPIVKERVLQMVTDAKRIYKSDKGHPDECNVYSYYKVFFKDDAKEVHDYCSQAQAGCKECKTRLALNLNKMLDPIRERREKFISKQGAIEEVLKTGNEKACLAANKVLSQARRTMKL